jgi:L,D-transpeptidase catalytic domain
MTIAPAPRHFEEAAPVDRAVTGQYAALYGPVSGERFPIPAVRLSDVHPEYLRKTVFYPTHEQPGTIVIDPQNHFLYLVQGGGRALRYGVGVGRQGFGWSGVATIHDKQEWPDWYPPKEMIERQPEAAGERIAKRPRRTGRPTQSARLSRHVPLAGQQGHALPHPRHGRTVDYRQERFLRLHPHDQPRRHRPLPADASWCEGRGAVIALTEKILP